MRHGSAGWAWRGAPRWGTAGQGRQLRWLDISGPPGSGKSTICDPIFGHREIEWDGAPPPSEWRPFLQVVRDLLGLVAKVHQRPGSAQAALRMNERSIGKMCTVARREDDRVYCQTAFCQRGVGFAWRLNEAGHSIQPVRAFFETMPTSLGAVFLTAPVEVLEARNRARRLNPKTAHEDRSFQVRLQLPGIELAKEVLNGRGVPFITVDTTQPVEAARAQLIDFAARLARDAAPSRPSGEAQVLSPSA